MHSDDCAERRQACDDFALTQKNEADRNSLSNFTESAVEDAALAWLESLGYAVLHGPEIAVGMPGTERDDPNYRDVVLEGRLRQALVRLNPDLPAEALEDAFRKLTRTDAPSLVERNRAIHRMLVDGVTVEYRRADGSIAGAQARLIDFETPENNDWLAVNQFTVAEGQHSRTGTVALRSLSYGYRRQALGGWCAGAQEKFWICLTGLRVTVVGGKEME